MKTIRQQIIDLLTDEEMGVRNLSQVLKIKEKEVLEHLPNPLEVITKLFGLIRPGGTLAIMTALHPGNWDMFEKWWYRKDDTHVSFFSKRTLEQLANALGADLALADNKNLAVISKAKIV